MSSSAKAGLHFVASVESGMLDSSREVNVIATALTARFWCYQTEQ